MKTSSYIGDSMDLVHVQYSTLISKLLSFMIQKTGDPLVAITFIIIIDCIFIPMISVTLVDQNVQNEKGKGLKPLTVQGFADDIALVTQWENIKRCD